MTGMVCVKRSEKNRLFIHFFPEETNGTDSVERCIYRCTRRAFLSQPDNIVVVEAELDRKDGLCILKMPRKKKEG